MFRELYDECLKVMNCNLTNSKVTKLLSIFLGAFNVFSLLAFRILNFVAVTQLADHGIVPYFLSYFIVLQMLFIILYADFLR